MGRWHDPKRFCVGFDAVANLGAEESLLGDPVNHSSEIAPFITSQAILAILRPHVNTDCHSS